jgi:hypothetical protein
MPMRIANTAARTMADALTTLANGGSLRVYSGSQPAEADAAPAGTLLGQGSLPSPAFAAATDAAPGGRATANAISAFTASVAGTLGWFRILSSGGATLWDGNVGLTGSGADMIVAGATLDIVLGGSITVSSLTVTMPEA